MTDPINQSIRDHAEALLARLGSGEGEEDFDASSFVHQLLAKYQMIAAIWCVEDVQQMRPDLDAEQAWEALQDVEHHHDAEYGISWTTLECIADIRFGPAPEIDDAEEARP
jgi:hypothetical protein